jgi:hypothetical protein
MRLTVAFGEPELYDTGDVAGLFRHSLRCGPSSRGTPPVAPAPNAQPAPSDPDPQVCPESFEV